MEILNNDTLDLNTRELKIEPVILLNEAIDLEDLNLLRQIRGFISIASQNLNGLTSENMSLFLYLLLEQEGLKVEKEKIDITAYILVQTMGEYINLNEMIDMLSQIDIKDLVPIKEISNIQKEIISQRISENFGFEIDLVKKTIDEINVENIKDVKIIEENHLTVYKIKYKGIFNFDKQFKFDKKNFKSIQKKELFDEILNNYIKK